jgi:hypothetical protein
MSWMNKDGLFVKFGKEEADTAAGGAYNVDGALKEVSVTIPYTELESASAAIVGSVGNSGARGVQLPKGALIEEVEIVVTEAFTSSGTIGSATFVSGTVEAGDRSTAADVDGLTTSSATGTALGLATTGTKTVLRQGSTGHGADIGGAALAENQILVAANSAHASHPYTAGELVMRIRYR